MRPASWGRGANHRDGRTRRHFSRFTAHTLNRYHPLREVARGLSFRIFIFQIDAPADIVPFEQEAD
jgi:hypothetical protein